MQYGGYMRTENSAPHTGPLDAFSLEELHQRTSVKWTAYDSAVLPMWVAEMDTSTVPAVTQVVTQILQAGDTGYPGEHAVSVEQARTEFERTGHANYRMLPTYEHAYVAFAQERWGLNVDPAAIRAMPDVMQGIGYAVKMLGVTDVAINTPVYAPFRFYSMAQGARVHEASLTPQGRIDFAALEEVFTKTSAYILCNPHNPSGIAHTPEELEQVFALASKHDVRVIVDEIHAPLTSPIAALAQGRDPFTPALSVPGSERALVLFSAAKGFNLAGFKAALMIAGPGAVADLELVPELVSHSSSTVSVAAHTAALVHGGQWLEQVRAGIDERRAQFIAGLAQVAPQAVVMPADATYFAWVDFSQVRTAAGDLMGNDPAQYLLDQARVAFNSGLMFGRGGEGFVRVNLATSAEVIDEAVRRIGEAVASAS